MDLRFENKPAFYVSGYPMETSEETLEKDCAMQREKYENKLRAISDRLYFASWMSDEGKMVYLLGVEAASQTSATDGATCIEVPAGRFAIAKVPKDAPILATWYEFFDKGLTSLGAEIDMEYPYYFESFDEHGACELWIPVKE